MSNRFIFKSIVIVSSFFIIIGLIQEIEENKVILEQLNQLQNITFNKNSDSEKPPHRSLNTDYVKVMITYTPNVAPEVGTVTLNGGSSIPLTENGTTTVQATATISDTNGISDISTTTGKLYRSGVGSSCSNDDNNCYSDSTCATTTPCAATSCTAICNYDVWFHADPTDSGSSWESEYWDAWIKVIDSADASSTATSSGEEVNTLHALDISASINYDSLNPGADSGTLSQTTTVTDTGNAAVDIYLYGDDMESALSSIAVSQQEYATGSSISYGSGTDLTNSSSTAVELDLSKPTSHPSTSTDDIYWGLGIPSVQEAGSYTGTTTFEAKLD